MRKIIKNFMPVFGKNCESTATLNLLKNAGVEISEPMLLGIGQSFGFIYWKMKIMNLPFIGGRSKPFDLTKTFCKNMNIPLEAKETTSQKKAWRNIAEFIDNDIPAGLQLDCYHLEHFKNSIHFAGHFACIYGYDDNYAYLVDTMSLQKVALENLEKARFEKGPMSAKARSWTIKAPSVLPAYKNVIPNAIKKVAYEFLNPPIKCFGYKGIQKLSSELPRWIKMSPNPKEDLTCSAEIMENGGTGGALFRNLYRDFLIESTQYLTDNKNLNAAVELYKQAAENWTVISALIHKAGITGEQSLLEKASAICAKTAEIEKNAMELLYYLTA
ncbi:MAG TPA: BtrH N-terminal domain-containing protein [bacterium]|nr:BtrH N-terminal domain-containing protein [bacterium]